MAGLSSQSFRQPGVLQAGTLREARVLLGMRPRAASNHVRVCSPSQAKQGRIKKRARRSLASIWRKNLSPSEPTCPPLLSPSPKQRDHFDRPFYAHQTTEVGQGRRGGGGSRGSPASSGLEVGRDLGVGDEGQSRLRMTRRLNWILNLGVPTGHAGRLLPPRRSGPLSPEDHQARPALAPVVLVGVCC